MKQKGETKKELPILWIFEENEEALRVFFAMRTQWVYAGFGVVVGLNYCALEFVMKTLRVKNRMECFEKIRTLEAETLRLQKEREKSDGPKALL